MKTAFPKRLDRKYIIIYNAESGVEHTYFSIIYYVEANGEVENHDWTKE